MDLVLLELNSHCSVGSSSFSPNNSFSGPNLQAVGPGSLIWVLKIPLTQSLQPNTIPLWTHVLTHSPVFFGPISMGQGSGPFHLSQSSKYSNSLVDSGHIVSKECLKPRLQVSEKIIFEKMDQIGIQLPSYELVHKTHHVPRSF